MDRALQQSLIAAIGAELGARQWSRARLGDLAGIPRVTMDRLFHSKRDMTVEQFRRIAGALDIPPWQLMERAAKRSAGVGMAGCAAEAPAPAPVDRLATQCLAFDKSVISSGLDDLFLTAGWTSGMGTTARAAQPTISQLQMLSRVLPLTKPVPEMDGFNDALATAQRSTTQSSWNSKDVDELRSYWAAIVSECQASK